MNRIIKTTVQVLGFFSFTALVLLALDYIEGVIHGLTGHNPVWLSWLCIAVFVFTLQWRENDD